MNAEAIFAEALAKNTAEERAAYLDEVCGQDAALRSRVETLLSSHESAGSFLDKPAIQAAAEQLAGQALGDRTQAESPAEAADEERLDFLAASDKPNSLGRLGHYEVLEIIGRGGMGIVLQAFDEKLHRVVAIKVMAAQLATNAAARKRFTREAQAQAAVSHDHVVGIHAVEETVRPSPLGGEGPGVRGLPYLVMQFVSGMSLQERLDKSGPLQLTEVVRIGMQTAAGLAAAHAQGLIHRDIKPANIHLENGVERVKITDFGLARAAADGSLTQSGVVAGTPYYMSPEQARGDAVDQRTDLFSLGSVLYAMCTGRTPFRANGSMAVLKRVCEETPTPIRETNPEVPEWLVAIIDKLQAKEPAQRYQSAAEVAELLGRHLAHLQHPSVAPVPVEIRKPGDKDTGRQEDQQAISRPSSLLAFVSRRRRWAIAAVVLLLLVGALSLAEAAGVTKLATTVIRIFTPEGTLVVEKDDPAVKLTVEGDGELVITGAGPQEVRLRAGSYKVRATKDGKPVGLDRDLVTIARGDRQIVRVRLGAEATAALAPKAEVGAFVVLGGKGGAVRTCDTLAEAVQYASAGDTVEVRGNGPFVTEPVAVHTRSLTIRAGGGYRPVIRLSPQASQDFQPLLWAKGDALAVEGIEFQRLGQKDWTADQRIPSIVYSGGAALHIANCRFRFDVKCPLCFCVYSDGDAPDCVVRNCEFLGPDSWGGYSVAGGFAGKLRVLEDCVHVGNVALNMPYGTSVRLTRNTLVSRHYVVLLHVYLPPKDLEKELEKHGAVEPTRVEASGNVFDASSVLWYRQDASRARASAPGGAPQPADAEALLLRLLAWHDRGNVYREGSASADWWFEWVKQTVFPRAGRSPADWRKFWKAPGAELTEGPIRYQGGDLLTKLAATPEKLTPEDFRLRPDSAGYHAGKDKKDLGADVDLVGPGAGYERWKKTPAYQQWLKETEQVKR
jgi:serine/threonine protein kinase